MEDAPSVIGGLAAVLVSRIRQRKVSQPRTAGGARVGFVKEAPTFQEFVDITDHNRAQTGRGPLPIEGLREEYISTYGQDPGLTPVWAERATS